MTLFDLRGKVVLVTGGNQGIGLGFARALAAAGANIVIWGRNAERNAEAAATLKQFRHRILAQSLDVTEELSVVAGIKGIVEDFGRLDAVFACAGVKQRAEPFEIASTTAWREILQANLDSVFWTFREACVAMKRQSDAGDAGGSLIAISSMGAFQGIPKQEAYSAAKGALESLTRSIAVEYARYGVRANIVQPGWIETEMTAPIRRNPAINDAIVKRIPMRRWGSPEDLGGIAIYLASSASRYHTGDTILIDGGYAAA